MSLYLNMDVFIEQVEGKTFEIEVFPSQDKVRLSLLIGQAQVSAWGIGTSIEIIIEHVMVWVNNNTLCIDGQTKYIAKFITAHNIAIDQEKLSGKMKKMKEELGLLEYFSSDLLYGGF